MIFFIFFIFLFLFLKNTWNGRSIEESYCENENSYKVIAIPKTVDPSRKGAIEIERALFPASVTAKLIEEKGVSEEDEFGLSLEVERERAKDEKEFT